jgi:Fe-S-cluster-containing dehydrogenase component
LVLGDVGKTDLQIVRESWKGRHKGGGSDSSKTSDSTNTTPHPQGEREPNSPSPLADERAALEALGFSNESGDPEFERFWKQALHDGIVKGTASDAKSVTLKDLPELKGIGGSGLELSFRPDPTIWDGRHANNGWLQELPKPMTRLTWDNAAFVAPRLAAKLGITNDQDSGACTLIELRYRGRSLRMPAWIMPGQAADSITIHLGYGRTQAGRVGNGAGFNAYALRTHDAPWGGPGLEVAATAATYRLATTQHHQNMNERHPVRAASLAEYQKTPDFARDRREEPAEALTLYPQFDYSKDYAWGMAINLNTCIGCGACVVACVAENNIPVVGKEQVLARRNMHWIRVDRYYEGDADNPRIYQQPVPCMHCENAPCELVCPVEATVHDHEGLNVMVYNRCVGTRYCSNNCPYKVRRFNFLQYSDLQTEGLKLQRNPNVTVRNRGVMEKCTYCTQRITLGRINAEMENRKVRDGEIVPACAQACPTRAIVFGDLNTKDGAVDRAKHDPRDYALLAELNTRPRTTYTARLENPNPAITPEPRDGDHATS